MSQDFKCFLCSGGLFGVGDWGVRSSAFNAGGVCGCWDASIRQNVA